MKYFNPRVPSQKSPTQWTGQYPKTLLRSIASFRYFVENSYPISIQFLFQNMTQKIQLHNQPYSIESCLVWGQNLTHVYQSASGHPTVVQETTMSLLTDKLILLISCWISNDVLKWRLSWRNLHKVVTLNIHQFHHTYWKKRLSACLCN